MGRNTLHNNAFQLLCRTDFETCVDFNSETVLYWLLLVFAEKVGLCFEKMM